MNDLLASVAAGLAAAFEPGDRVEVAVTEQPDRLLVPPAVWAAEHQIEAIEDAGGAPLDITVDPAAGCVTVAGSEATCAALDLGRVNRLSSCQPSIPGCQISVLALTFLDLIRF